MAAKKRAEHSVFDPFYRVAPLGEIKVYPLTEEELDAIGRGSPGSIFLNFALALLPLSAAFLITLLTTTIDNLGTLVFFISACIICFISGTICLVLARHYHKTTIKVIERIKSRMPPIAEPVDETVVRGTVPRPGESSAPATADPSVPPSAQQPENKP